MRADPRLNPEPLEELLQELLEWQKALMLLIQDLLDEMAEPDPKTNSSHTQDSTARSPRRWRVIH